MEYLSSTDEIVTPCFADHCIRSSSYLLILEDLDGLEASRLDLTTEVILMLPLSHRLLKFLKGVAGPRPILRMILLRMRAMVSSSANDRLQTHTRDLRTDSHYWQQHCYYYAASMALSGAYLEIAIIGQQQYCQHLWHWVGPGNIYTCTLHENINIL